MYLTLSQFSRSITAETYKLKRTPLLWITLIGGLFVAAFIFLIFFLKWKELATPDRNPWIIYYQFGYVMISMLLAVPFAILVTSSLLHFEHHSDTWKYLYTLPLPKFNFYFSKLLVALLLIALAYTTFFFSILATAYLLDVFHPTYQFRAYFPEVAMYLRTIGHVFIAMLGVVGLHYWFSLRWKKFIAPVGIGLLGFIIAIFLFFTKRFDLALYWPYAYPGLMGFEFGPEGETTGLSYFAGLTSAECWSVSCFILFTGLGFYEEKVKNVK